MLTESYDAGGEEDRLMRWYLWIGFGVLCVLSASAWLIPPLASDALPALERQGLLYGGVGLGWGWGGCGAGSGTKNGEQQLVGASIVFGLPSVYLKLAMGGLGELSARRCLPWFLLWW